ncbi:unnamed protein product [Fusarium graminearum]|nr:unnamed protein product [Fusarium graminearum]
MCTTVISIITCSNCRRQLSSVYELTLQYGWILVVHSVPREGGGEEEEEEEKEEQKLR